MQFYRFRNMKYLLEDKYQELKKQEIYLASPEQLNDPMEGLQDIFWRGDKIVWENFFKHYVFCLYRTYYHFLLADPFIQLHVHNIPIQQRWDQQSVPARRLFDDIWDRFLDLSGIPEFIETLANTNREIRVGELKRYLQTIHFALFDEIEEVFFANGIIPQPTIIPPNEGQRTVGERLESWLASMTAFEEGEVDTNAVLRFYEADRYGRRLKFQLNNVILTEISKRNVLLLHYDFPSVYLQEIEKLLWFDWRTACFMKDYHNSAVWSFYGGDHKGACLIFESTGGSLQLDLDEGANPGREAIEFRKVVYGDKLNEIDFFRSIGRVTVGQLIELWYTDAEGNFSECGSHIQRDGETENDDTARWHESYWNNFYYNTTYKTKDWEYEQESRLVLEERWLDAGENYKLTYDFNSLKGIIFGIRASDEEILKAIKIIQKKCEEHDRTDFKFYKAEYSHKTGDIRKYQMLLPEALQNAR